MSEQTPDHTGPVCPACGCRTGAAIVSLVEEVYRLRSDLRSDEWLERAADEIARETDNDGCIDNPDGPWTSNRASVLAILRKHRDAKS